MTSFQAGGLPTLRAHVRLSGQVNEEMLGGFHEQMAVTQPDGPLVFELTTTGGDADTGRRLALEIRLLREREGRDVFFLGKSTVYSAGVTFMAAFPATHRFITTDCVLLIHERRMDKELKLSGALRACAAIVGDALAEIRNGELLQRAGFEELIEGSSVSIDELMGHVRDANWYISARDALERGLVAGVI